jgi:tetratricopeptide (TPR) repeat protein
MDFSTRKLLSLVLVAALASGCSRKSTGEKHFATGLAYYKESKFDKAIPQFEGALSSMQTNALALNFLGVCRLQEGETEAGLQNLQAAVRLDPNYVPARYNLALAQLEHGQADDAVANLRQVVQSGVSPADSQYQLGLAYMRVSAWGQAEEAFKRHLQSNADSTDTLNCLGIVAAHKHEFPEAKRWLEQSIAANSKFATAYLNLASLESHQLGQKKEALAHYETYTELVPKSQPHEDVRLAMLQIQQDLAMAAKQPLHAIEPAKPAKAPEPPPSPPVEITQPPKPAAPPPEAVAPKPPTLAPSTVVTVSAVTTMSSPPPPQPPVRKVRTPIAAKTLKPGNRAQAQAYFNEGVTFQLQNKPANAVADYTKAITADPTFAKAYYNLAITYRNAAQTGRALDNYELALIADPNYADARFNYAVLLQEQGYSDDAIAQFERILAGNPNDASTHLSLGGLYARDRATYARAREHYEVFLRLSPNSPLARDIRRWLDQNR